MAARRETADPAPSQTPVGADSISARFAAGQGPAGGPWPSPTNHGEHRAKWEGHTPPGGRRAGCPHPAAPRGGANACGRIWNPPLRPTAGPRPNGQTAALRLISGLCRGRCLHCARRRVSEANRATGPALRPEIVPQTPQRRKVPREGHGPPLQTVANARPNGKGTRPPAAVGRDALIPPHPAAAGAPAGGINPSPTNHGGPAAKRANRGPAVISDLCRGRCLHRPGNPAAAQARDF